MNDLSVVIGFKDWGLQRIELAARSIAESFGTATGEVILSDYGSEDHKANAKLARKLGMGYVFSEDDVWSRSRALNAGMAISTGELLVSTDADMIFSPRSFERIFEIFSRDPSSAYFLQCRDLPEGFDDEVVAAAPRDWAIFSKVGRLRPRWGMGGMMAISRQGFEETRGFDERLHTYGGEDLDFALRARRVGYRTRWIDDPDVRMYHMWHPPTRRRVEAVAGGTEAIRFNTDTVYHDKTPIRNFLEWRYPQNGTGPLVTISIATKDRAPLLKETIKSALTQTMQDFEIVVVDDGGSDEAQSVCESFEDSRIRYFWQEEGGISKARNRVLDEARGKFVAVVDDDDLMHHSRLQWHLESLTAGSAGNVGSFVNFDDETGDLSLYVSYYPTLATAAEKGSAPGHGTWFVQTEMLRKFRYDESISSGVDNNLMLRMLRSGVELDHIGKAVLLRRMHATQVTQTEPEKQGDAARQSLHFLQWSMSESQRTTLASEKAERNLPSGIDRAQLVEDIRPFLPDHLVSRDMTIENHFDTAQPDWDGKAELARLTINGEDIVSKNVITGASYNDMIAARQCGLRYTVKPSEVVGKGSNADVIAARDFQDLLGELFKWCHDKLHVNPVEELQWFVVYPSVAKPKLQDEDQFWKIELISVEASAQFSAVLVNREGAIELARKHSGSMIVGPNLSAVNE